MPAAITEPRLMVIRHEADIDDWAHLSDAAVGAIFRSFFSEMKASFHVTPFSPSGLSVPTSQVSHQARQQT
jgi:hypothetical protein